MSPEQPRDGTRSTTAENPMHRERGAIGADGCHHSEIVLNEFKKGRGFVLCRI